MWSVPENSARSDLDALYREASGSLFSLKLGHADIHNRTTGRATLIVPIIDSTMNFSIFPFEDSLYSSGIAQLTKGPCLSRY